MIIEYNEELLNVVLIITTEYNLLALNLVLCNVT